jgi:anti-anti-sigma factor
MSSPVPHPDPPEPSGLEPEERPDPFALRVEPIGDGWIEVIVEGELALTSAAELEGAVDRELRADRNVLLDFSRVAFIDSYGLRAVATLTRTARETGRELRLTADLPDHVRRLMEIVGLLPFVPIGGA